MTPDPLPEDDTQEDDDRARPRARERLRPFLFLAFEADRPLAGGARVSLTEVDEVLFRRGDRGATFDASEARRIVTFRLPGRGVSASHAHLRRSNEGWLLEDAGSTNGTYVNGVRCARTLIGENDIIEIGRSFLMLRNQHAEDDEPRYRDGADFAQELDGLATLRPVTSDRLSALRRVAASPIPVILSGETGTGKELVARAIHELSGRSGPFIAVNCAALTEHLGAVQLLGHQRGAFTGVVTDAPGFVQAASGGTLLLDEVQELVPAMQAALLRILQEQEVVPVGAVRPIKVDVRVIATSPLALDEAVHRGTFRADLFARLNGFHHRVEPLRKRTEDLGLLLAALLRGHGVGEMDHPRIAPELGELLLRHEWPFNVRELDQWLARAWLFARDGLMESGHPFATDAPRSVPASEVLRSLSPDDRILKERLVSELEKAGGNVSLVARSMRKAPVQIRRWAKRLGVELESFRQREA